MEMLYKNEHEDCPNHDNGPSPTIEIKELTKGEVFVRQPNVGRIIFLLEGHVNYSFGSFNDCAMSRKQMLFLPPDYHFKFKVSKDAHILMIRLLDKIQLCESYMLESLLHQTIGINRKPSGRSRKEPALLEMNQAMDIYIDGLMFFMRKGICCKYYFNTKVKELFYLFRAFYPKEDLAMFFKRALSLDAGFTYLVVNNYYKYRTFSEMSKAMNMSPSGLEKRFKKAFGVSGYKWMNEHRAKKIYHAICNEGTPFKSLSVRFGFATKSSFNDFCKKNLGFPPGQIRKNAHQGPNDEQVGRNK